MGLPVLPSFSGPPEITNLINYLNTLTQQNIPQLLAQPQAVMVPNLFNWNPSNLKYLRKAIANVRNGVQNAKIACIGDSTVAGLGSNASTAKYRVNSWPARFATFLAGATGMTVNADNIFGTANLTMSAYCDKCVLSGGAAQTAVNLTLGGGLMQMTNTGHTVSFTPTLNCDTFDVYSVKTGGTGAQTINLDGGATLATVSGTVGGGAVVKTSVSGSLAAHVLNCVWQSGTNYFVGADCYNSAVKQASIWNMGASGVTSANLADTATGYAAKNALATYAPDCTIICVGVNDWNTGIPVATYLANLQAVITTALISGDVILLTPPPSRVDVASLATQAGYVAALYQLANQFSIPVVDLWGRFGAYEQLSSAGYYFDTLHPNGIGYSDVAGFVTTAVRGMI